MLNPDRRHCNFLILVALSALSAISCAKPAAPTPKPQAPPPFEYLQTWGQHGEGPGLLDAPIAFTVDTQSRVYFADPISGFVHKFEATGVPLFSFEEPQVKHADGIAVDSGGAIYLANADRGDISIFFPEGIPLRAQHFSPQPHHAGPFSIHVDDAGNLYVPDEAHSRITKFDDHGRLANSWVVPHTAPSPSEFPTFVATSQDGSIFVAFGKTGRIERYSVDGTFVATWNAVDRNATGSNAISGFAVSGTTVFALVAAPPRLRVWTLDGQHKLDDNLGGHLDGVSEPQIAVTPREELLVFHPQMLQVLRFRIHF
jgi:sugar lactone lactonase YvrE